MLLRCVLIRRPFRVAPPLAQPYFPISPESFSLLHCRKFGNDSQNKEETTGRPTDRPTNLLPRVPPRRRGNDGDWRDIMLQEEASRLFWIAGHDALTPSCPSAYGANFSFIEWEHDTGLNLGGDLPASLNHVSAAQSRSRLSQIPRRRCEGRFRPSSRRFTTPHRRRSHGSPVSQQGGRAFADYASYADRAVFEGNLWNSGI